jgi:putative flippase GtrA
VIVGLWNTLFAWLAFVGCYAVTQHFGLSYLLATIPAQFVAILNAFVLQRYVVFGSAGTSVAGSFLRFSLVYWALWAINTGALALLVSTTKLDPRVASGLLAVANAGISYVLHGRFTFAGRGSPSP